MVKVKIQKKSTKQKLNKASLFLKCISDKNRLKILHILQRGETCVCKIEKATGLSQNLTSHHLRILKNHEVISARRVGTFMHYKLRDRELMEKIKEINEILLIQTKQNK